jgi:hypothetical protein
MWQHSTKVSRFLRGPSKSSLHHASNTCSRSLHRSPTYRSTTAPPNIAAGYTMSGMKGAWWRWAETQELACGQHGREAQRTNSDRNIYTPASTYILQRAARERDTLRLWLFSIRRDIDEANGFAIFSAKRASDVIHNLLSQSTSFNLTLTPLILTYRSRHRLVSQYNGRWFNVTVDRTTRWYNMYSKGRWPY